MIRSTRTSDTVYCHRGAGRRQDSSGRRFPSPIGGQMRRHRSAEPGRHARHRLQPERRTRRTRNLRVSLFCPFNRGAGGRQDFGGWRLLGANGIRGTQLHRAARCHHRRGRFVRPEREQCCSSIAVQADGKILAGGGFSSIGGQPRNLIARLDATNGLADSFDPSANGFVRSIAVQADGKVLVGGDFTTRATGQRRSRATTSPGWKPTAGSIRRSI